jgi:O-antigen/teichoic acid export membrane protein
MYDILFKISIVGGMLTLLNSILIWQFSYGIVEYVLVSIVISFVLSLLNFHYLYSSKILSFKKILFCIKLVVIKKTFKSQVWSYSTPLLGVSFISYIRKYLPIYLFGTMVSLETLAVYSVFQNITDFLHKGYAGFIQALYPKLFQIMQLKTKAIDSLFWIGLALRLVVFITLYFGYDLILSLYNIQ